MSTPNPKIYLLPNLMTAGNLFCGFAATLQIVQGALLQVSDPDSAAKLFHIAVWFILGACIFEFAHTGRGTLAPVDPPRVLVVRGLYRYVRNPMYLSVTLIVWGEILLTRSVALIAYWLAWFVAANLFVRGYEEPALRRQFGSDYDRYAAKVGRWMPKLRSRK